MLRIHNQTVYLFCGFSNGPPVCVADCLSNLAGEDVLRPGDQHCCCGESARI